MKKKSGLAFHCHHGKLVEWVYDLDERVRFIKQDKLKSEQKLRLKLFKLIPMNKLPIDLRRARAAYNKAGAAYDILIEKHEDYFIKLHSELCPGCPWDGTTIFPKSG